MEIVPYYLQDMSERVFFPELYRGLVDVPLNCAVACLALCARGSWTGSRTWFCHPSRAY